MVRISSLGVVLAGLFLCAPGIANSPLPELVVDSGVSTDGTTTVHFGWVSEAMADELAKTLVLTGSDQATSLVIERVNGRKGWGYAVTPVPTLPPGSYCLESTDADWPVSDCFEVTGVSANPAESALVITTSDRITTTTDVTWSCQPCTDGVSIGCTRNHNAYSVTLSLSGVKPELASTHLFTHVIAEGEGGDTSATGSETWFILGDDLAWFEGVPLSKSGAASCVEAYARPINGGTVISVVRIERSPVRRSLSRYCRSPALSW